MTEPVTDEVPEPAPDIEPENQTEGPVDQADAGWPEGNTGDTLRALHGG